MNLSNEMQQRLSELLDREAIRELRLRYSHLLDSGQAERMDEVFTKDALVKVTVGSMQGLSEIKQGLTQAYQDFDTGNRQHFPFVHAIANHEITLIDNDHAKGSCYLLDFVTDRDAAQHPFLLLGHYVDDYVRVDGEWRIARSELDVVWPESE